MADARLSAFDADDPWTDGPWRVVTRVLLVTAFKVSNPIEMLILVEANNFSGQTPGLWLCGHGMPVRRKNILSAIGTIGKPDAAICARSRSRGR